MAIRWNAALVAEKCDEAEKILAPALPIIEHAARVLAEIGQIDNMPQYITSPASNAEACVKNCASKAKEEIDRVRRNIPEEEIAKCRFKGKATTLGLEVHVLPKVREYNTPPRRQQQYSGPEPRVQDGTRQTQLAIR